MSKNKARVIVQVPYNAFFCGYYEKEKLVRLIKKMKKKK